MRSLLVLLSIGLIVTLAIVFADLQAPRLTTVGVGSLGFEPEAVGLKPLPPGDGCEDAGSSATDRPCARRFAFAPNGTLKTWISVRNDGPLSVTLDGVRQSWLDQFAQTAFLAHPVVVTDAGDAFRKAGRDDGGAAFQPIVLETGDQRVVGLEFRTTSNVTDACQRWSVGSGVIFESIPIHWHWLQSVQAQEIAFADPVEFMAPTATDCAT